MDKFYGPPSPFQLFISAGNYGPHSRDSLLLAIFLFVVGLIGLVAPKKFWTSKLNGQYKEGDTVKAGKIVSFSLFVGGAAMFAYWSGWVDVLVSHLSTRRIDWI